ncbi:hypothetical protein DL93DRAFT_2164549 [Clavulina sp. PMI_390]|nr:hypothetical protein DL93DRAFT_2164549 [Clavulina sp. PMI_390]
MVHLSTLFPLLVATSSLARRPRADHRALRRGSQLRVSLADGDQQNYFPASTFLGYGLDFTTFTPSDINAVIGGLKTRTAIINVNTTTYTDATIAGVQYNVPENCFITADTATESAVSTYYADGSTAASAFETDASLAGKYLAVSASADASYAISKTFHSNTQYSLFNFQSLIYIAGLKNWAGDIDETPFITAVKRLGTWDSTNSTIITAYRNFFASYGSHAITSVQYGARYSLTVWGSTSDQSVNQNWQADVAVAYDGVSTSGQFNASVSGSSEYSSFLSEKSQQISVQGGDPNLADALTSGYGNSSNYDNFSQWVKTTYENADLMSITVDSIWDVFSSAQSDTLYYAAQDLQDAFQWIVQNPAPHWTYVSLSLSTDWARFRLLNPGSYIVEDPANPYTNVPGATLTRNQVQIGVEHSHDYTNTPVVYFYVVNDGSPLDFTLSHGSGGQRSATVILNNAPITNNQITDNYWNEIAYWSIPANPQIHVDEVAGTTAARRHGYTGYGPGSSDARGQSVGSSKNEPEGVRSSALRPALFRSEF